MVVRAATRALRTSMLRRGRDTALEKIAVVAVGGVNVIISFDVRRAQAHQLLLRILSDTIDMAACFVIQQQARGRRRHLLGAVLLCHAPEAG